MRTLFRIAPAAVLLAGELSLSVLASATPDIAAETATPVATVSPPGCHENRPGTPIGADAAPRRLDASPALGEREQMAALEAVQLALSEVGDGATYVWHAHSGRISGSVTPTQSFKDGAGTICRHVVVALTAGAYSRQTEGLACRLASGIWQLEG